eukprot:gnl/TRDRNA2_/TRDRNA2_178526_c0_seq1.p2 gnl/TRDRNA2_/TRDRNA2_178526_c0~~gnl/TRDRNA2_/TRDRNA2_178526_c0_seq1.p2  ORF type:complete len:140 (+),score=39.36 gnl/TRDRNA2_/TRDRNA2_178526_c0_seq1:109-528(+)
MAAKYQDRLARSSGVSSRAFESDFGKKILLKYGWQEGQGLGRLNNGRTDCLQGERREEKVGLGQQKRKAEDHWDNWWADCFNDVAKKISVKDVATKSVPRPKSDDTDSDDDDDIAPRITAIKRAGAMAGKLRRVQRQEA